MNSEREHKFRLKEFSTHGNRDNKICFSQVSLSSGPVSVCVVVHIYQNLKYALTLLKINRMALLKTVKYETSNCPFSFYTLLPEARISKFSWLRD